MIKIVVAPDKFKHSLSAKEVCHYLTIGLKKNIGNVKVIEVPMADGGEGTLSALIEDLGLAYEKVVAKDPLFRDIQAHYGVTEDRKQAYIEMAAASGLMLLKENERNPMKTTSYGTGQLIKHALDNGAEAITLFVGGSATNDGGIGMANALGYQFLDQFDKIISPIGENLSKICEIEASQIHPNLADVEFVVATDVTNPLTGPNGAALVYGAQKGANSSQIKYLDKGLEHLVSVSRKWNQQETETTSGAGAAGGMGFGAMIFLNAKIESGIEHVMHILKMPELIQDADLVISGEGNLDHQSLNGKVVDGIRREAAKHQVPFGVVCGGIQLSSEELAANKISFRQSLEEISGSREAAIAEAGKYVTIAAENIAKTFLALLNQ